MDGILSHMVEVLDAKNIFERKNMQSRAIGILLYHYGLYLGKCRSIVSNFELISHESIRN
jgi:hypothetical protein